MQPSTFSSTLPSALLGVGVRWLGGGSLNTRLQLGVVKTSSLHGGVCRSHSTAPTACMPSASVQALQSLRQPLRRTVSVQALQSLRHPLLGEETIWPFCGQIAVKSGEQKSHHFDTFQRSRFQGKARHIDTICGLTRKVAVLDEPRLDPFLGGDFLHAGHTSGSITPREQEIR